MTPFPVIVCTAFQNRCEIHESELNCRRFTSRENKPEMFRMRSGNLYALVSNEGDKRFIFDNCRPDLPRPSICNLATSFRSGAY
jgi:hypothetical protein